MKIRTLTGWYLKNERWISSLALVGGFIVDMLTLRRVDLLLENVWVLSHLFIASVGILLINLHENKRARFSEKVSRIIHFWLIMLIQFSFGAMMSTFLVFYFRSSTLSASWPFLALLAFIFISNDMLKHHYSRLILQVSVLYISIYSFAIFIVPVLAHEIGPAIFVLSGFLSLILLGIFLFCLRFIARERFQKSKNLLVITIAAITLLINILYFTNLIPPIPLSLKDAGVYHSIVHMPDGNYSAVGEKKPFWSFFAPYETFHEMPGQQVYVYSSIFSPTGLSTQVVHDWQKYDEATQKWISINQTPLSIVGGRDAGFRTYSIKIIDGPALWRVDVKTPKGQLIGRIKFKIVENTDVPEMVTKQL